MVTTAILSVPMLGYESLTSFDKNASKISIVIPI